MGKNPSSIREKRTGELWTSLVESAFDFFERAVDEHDSAPKYAILHLATSVELFLKARLMAEHWTLIASPKKTPTFDQLKSGDFQSVTPDEAVERINSVLPNEYHVAKDAENEFRSLVQERNKVAHFFHAGLNGKTQPQGILQRQCRVWFHMQRLLTKVWEKQFKAFANRLDKLDTTMRGQRKFLNAIFENATDELNQHQDAGLLVASCPACGFEALMVSDGQELTSGRCAVCRYQSSLLRLTCPECKTEDILLEHGYDSCPNCNHAFTPEELSELLHVSRPDDGTGFRSLSIYCCDCETDEVYELDGRYVCLNCMQEWDEISMCDWCSEYTTGNTEDSYFYGCPACGGRRGDLDDKD